MRELTIGDVKVRIYAETRTVTTIFPDGVQLHASPESNDEYRERARTLGYTDYDPAFQMCLDHEIGHQYLAIVWHKQPWSWVIWDVAHGSNHTTVEQRANEEAEVLAWQARLDKTRPRPWDKIDPRHPSVHR